MISKAQLVQWLQDVAGVLADNKNYLTELDSAIGDADHGVNMDRGFKKVLEKMPSFSDKDVGSLMKGVGMALMSSVGGASGPLYGTFFMRAGQSAADKDELSDQDLLAMLRAGVEGILQRGRAVLGDKTMFDVWQPALDTLEQALQADKPLDAAFAETVSRAEEAMKATIPLQARKGRASYLGERSIGHQDPGATSTYLMLKAMSDVISSGAPD